MKIEIWSDVVCPWCYIGKRRIEAAIEQFDEPIEVEWRSFELDPRTRTNVEGPLVEALARKYRMPTTQAQAMMDRVASLADCGKTRFQSDFDHLAVRRGIVVI